MVYYTQEPTMLVCKARLWNRILIYVVVKIKQNFDHLMELVGLTIFSSIIFLSSW